MEEKTYLALAQPPEGMALHQLRLERLVGEDVVRHGRVGDYAGGCVNRENSSLREREEEEGEGERNGKTHTPDTAH